ncbi:hypothetical protein EYF80_058301 [Liparis tanakae]|uniref:Uncharacterized protein n=1 Tax=Liparis tanakae TaxID=230148 RepID=A0A4Z2ERK9_9TELE|nr:hypothetical protein EYF80_058301 [Liparis tanakae]
MHSQIQAGETLCASWAAASSAAAAASVCVAEEASYKYSLVFLGGGLRPGGGAGELPPLSPPEEPLSWAVADGPAVTWKSQFSLEMRNSSWREESVTVRRSGAAGFHGVGRYLKCVCQRLFGVNKQTTPGLSNCSGTSLGVRALPLTTLRRVPERVTRPTFSWLRLVAVFQSLSSRIRVMRGKRMEIPSAVCISERENSAPVGGRSSPACGGDSLTLLILMTSSSFWRRASVASS